MWKGGFNWRNLFAIGGCKLLSNASKDWSDARAYLAKKQKKIGRAVRRMLTHYKEDDFKQINEPESR